MPPRSRPASRERRQFLKLLVAGSAAVLTGADPAAAATKPRPRARRVVPGRPARIGAEIENQKRTLAQALAVIRDFPLEPGSESGFVFVPLVPPASGKARVR